MQYFVAVQATTLALLGAIHDFMFMKAFATPATIKVAEHKVKALTEEVVEQVNPMIRCLPQSRWDVHVLQQMYSDFDY